MSLGRLRIKRQLFLHRRASLRYGLLGLHKTEIPHEVVAVGDASISRREAGIARNSQIEILDGAAEVGFRTFVPEEESAEVCLVEFWVMQGPLRKIGLLFGVQTECYLLSDGSSNLPLEID